MAVLRHVHKYFRNKTSGLWTCGFVECTHHMPKNAKGAIGGKSICWRCGNEFILNEDLASVEKPICYPCKRTPQVTIDEIEADYWEYVENTTDNPKLTLPQYKAKRGIKL